VFHAISAAAQWIIALQRIVADQKIQAFFTSIIIHKGGVSVSVDRVIQTEEIPLGNFVHRLMNGEFLIPSFQREFIWHPEDIIKLWDSIYRFYPIGSILYWTTHIRLHIHRKLGGVILFHNDQDMQTRKEWVYILDGQQRATSLLVSLFGAKTKVTTGNSFDYSIYFDATTSSFFFGNDFNRRKRQVQEAFLIRIGDVMNGYSAFDPQIEKEPGYSQTIADNLHQLSRVISDYPMSFIHLTGFDIPAVREIFERINVEGKDLSSTDLMIARTFRNYAYLVEEDV
jgi:uncharacterized protein with ParB-like and HNH nuclease domain